MKQMLTNLKERLKMRYQTFLNALFSLTALFILFTGTAHAAITDCIGQNSDGGVPGQAICVPPVPVPIGSGEGADEDAWSYDLCSDYPYYWSADLSAWCRARDGQWIPGGFGASWCDFKRPVYDEDVVPYSDNYVRERFNSICDVQGPVDSGWGQTIDSIFCYCYTGKPEGPLYQNDTLIRDFRTVDFIITTQDNLGNCSNTFPFRTIARKQRRLECPTGTRTRYKSNGDLECWYLPADRCETVGRNGGISSGFSGMSGAGVSGASRLTKSSCNLVGNPINTALMNKMQREEDLPMTSGGLQFVRYFNSTPWPPVHPETRKTTWDYWRHTYMRRIVVPY
ncbi:MAG: hypothetical protein FWC38_06045, partial [Proteobacteria bacterium]|nr:hypothetical protein [Pseudomonadota bacterium]MCL2307772.1 hypothetical protein [Pseudomonadota bacterium]